VGLDPAREIAGGLSCGLPKEAGLALL
jgi:hypothetical protein